MMLLHIKKKLDLYIKEERINSKSLKIQLAYSGGLDSSCLLHTLIKLKAEYNIVLFLTYINYSTSKYSTDVLKHINNIDLSDANKSVHTSSVDDKMNFESEARSIRYKFLNKIHTENNIDLTFTAHHFNDQIETVLMKFIDGSDYVSLQGIRPKLGFIFRPILDLDKNSIIKYANSNKVIYFEDPSNADISFIRNKVRKFIMPNILKDKFLINKIKNINNISIQKFYNTKEKINKDLAKIEFKDSLRYIFIELSDFKKYDLIEAKIYLSSILRRFFNLKFQDRSKAFWVGVYEFILSSKTGAIFNFSKNIFILKNRKGFFLYDHNFLSKFYVDKVRVTTDFDWGIGRVACSGEIKEGKRIKDEILVDKYFFSEGLYIRAWEHGDRIVEKNKKISDILIKMKIPLFFKNKYPIVEDSKGNIVWVPGAYFNKKYESNSIEGQRILWIE